VTARLVVLVTVLLAISVSGGATSRAKADGVPACPLSDCGIELEKLLAGQAPYEDFYSGLVAGGDGASISDYMLAASDSGLMPDVAELALEAGAVDGGALDAAAAASVGASVGAFVIPVVAGGAAVYLALHIDWSHAFNGWTGPVPGTGYEQLTSARYQQHICSGVSTADHCHNGWTYTLTPVPNDLLNPVPAAQYVNGSSPSPWFDYSQLTCDQWVETASGGGAAGCPGSSGLWAPDWDALAAAADEFKAVATASPGYVTVASPDCWEGTPTRTGSCYAAFVPNPAELLTGTGALTGADVTTTDPGGAVDDWPGECSAGAGSGTCVWPGDGSPIETIDDNPALKTAVDAAIDGATADDATVPDCDGVTYPVCLSRLQAAGFVGTIRQLGGDEGTNGDPLESPGMVQQLSPQDDVSVAYGPGWRLDPSTNIDIHVWTDAAGAIPGGGDTPDPTGGGINAGGPDGGGCTAPSIPPLDFSPLNVPIGDKFPFALFSWISGIASSLVATGEAPTFTIPIDPPGPLEWDLTVDLAPADEMMAFLRPILAGFTILGAIVFVAKGALGFGASAPTATGE
jgi:hypothetical protein